MAHGKDIKARTGKYASMEHRHYATIAAIIWGRFEDRETYSKEDIARAFAEELRGTNPNFNKDRFLKAAVGTKE